MAENTPETNFELVGGYPPKRIERGAHKILSLGIDGAVVRQVRKYFVCFTKLLLLAISVVFYLLGGYEREIQIGWLLSEVIQLLMRMT